MTDTTDKQASGALRQAMNRSAAVAKLIHQRTDTMTKAKDFNSSMVELQLQVSQAYAAEVHKLRQENKELRAAIAAIPSTATELQDRVTMLEGLLAAATLAPPKD